MPTQLRSQGTALANVMSMVSQIASPYVVGSVSILTSCLSSKATENKVCARDDVHYDIVAHL
jgi:hypothetical protein